REEVYVSKWFAFKRMQFLLDKDDPVATINTEQGNEEEEEEPENVDPNVSQNIMSQETEDSVTKSVAEETSSVEFVSPVQPKQKRKKINRQDESKFEEAYTILKAAVAALATTSDPADIFGQHIAGKLKQYSQKARVQVEYAINNIIYDADMGKYDLVSTNPPPLYLTNQHTHVSQIFASNPVPSPTSSYSSSQPGSSTHISPNPNPPNILPPVMFDLDYINL
ncbi:hypothetical protein NQ314_000614, partial [Rhamnusium bicolor]